MKNNYKLSKYGRKMIQQFEGYRAYPYLDVVGVPTIGYGNTYYPDGTKVTLKDKKLTPREGDRLFTMIVKQFEDAVNNLVTVKITQNQYDALVSLAYNIGIGALGKSSLLKAINGKLGRAEIEKAYKRWNTAGGRVHPVLTARRLEELDLFLL